MNDQYSHSTRSADERPSRTFRRRGAAFLGVVACTALIIAGCSTDDDSAASELLDDAPIDLETSSSDDDTTTSLSTTTTEPRSPERDERDATAAEPFDAIATALANGGVAVELDRDDDDGELVWEIKVRNDDGSGIQYDISVASGNIVRQEHTSIDDEAALPHSITMETALRTALDALDSALVEDADLDREDGRLIWDIQLRQTTGVEVEIHVDAETGEIVKHDVDD